MEKSEKEIHDFMNVESFAQLPFIRPSATTAKEKGIRLFGKEFGSRDDQYFDSVATNMSDEIKDSENGESSKKFECHYCCRNFPTSQALGGHQNAHKRERQHAKRAHLDHLHFQSAMIHRGGHGGAAYCFSHSHNLYGLMKSNLASSPKPPASMPFGHSWTSKTNGRNTSRFYGNHGSLFCRPLINGSPLALWKIPAVQNSSTASNSDHSPHPLQFFAKDGSKTSPMNGSNRGYVYESKPNVQDHVSLDLHL